MKQHSSPDSRKNLIITTVAYPLGGLTERAFLLPELEALRQRFRRVIIVPLLDRGPLLALPEGIEFSDCVARSPFTRHKLLRPLLAPATPLSWLLDSPSYALAASSAARELIDFARREGLDGSNTLAYSFWFEYSFPALALLKKKLGIPFVSRAHTYDIRIGNARRIRSEAVKESEGVWAISRLAQEDLKSRFPESGEKFHVAYLGVEIPAAPALRNEDPAAFNVVSNSRVVPLKRLELNILFMQALAQARPSVKFTLTHIGGTPQDLQHLHQLTHQNPIPTNSTAPNQNRPNQSPSSKETQQSDVPSLPNQNRPNQSPSSKETQQSDVPSLPNQDRPSQSSTSPENQQAEVPSLPNLEYRFLGNLQHEDVIDTLQKGRFDLYLLLSNTEGIPVAMMEAMANGIPAAVTNVGAVSEAMTPECGALLSADPTPEEFLQKILPLVDDRTKQQACAKAARRQITAAFNSAALRPAFPPPLP